MAEPNIIPKPDVITPTINGFEYKFESVSQYNCATSANISQQINCQKQVDAILYGNGTAYKINYGRPKYLPT